MSPLSFFNASNKWGRLDIYGVLCFDATLLGCACMMVLYNDNAKASIRTLDTFTDIKDTTTTSCAKIYPVDIAQVRSEKADMQGILLASPAH
jgi:hypothetical protein